MFRLFFSTAIHRYSSKRVIQSGCNHARPHPQHSNINLMCHSPCRDLSRGHANQHLTQSASEADEERRRCLRRLCRYLAINGKICPAEMWLVNGSTELLKKEKRKKGSGGWGDGVGVGGRDWGGGAEFNVCAANSRPSAE